MTVALENIKDRCKLRDLRYSRDLRTMTVAIRRFMDGFLCVCLTFPVFLINNVPLIISGTLGHLLLGRLQVVLQELFLKEIP